MKKIFAFTLAEVLVTLMIIGVIASMTVPGLKKTADEQSYVSGAQKAYSTVSAATKMIKTEQGPVRFWRLNDIEATLNLYKSKINSTGGTAAAYPATYLNEAVYNNPNMFDPKASFMMADGMLFYILGVVPACNGQNIGAGNTWANGCINIGIDVNGPKEPNVVGIDIFGFYVTADGTVHPEGGGQPGVDMSSCSDTAAGWGCTAKILKDGKITW